jgi:hypothetical protein
MKPEAPRTLDERGSTLLFALVMIVVISIAGVSVLHELSSSGNVQTAYSNVRTSTLNFDATAQAMVNRLRGDPLAGINSAALATTCNTYNTFQQIGTSGVFCSPSQNSGLKIGTTPDVPPFTVETLGGSVYTGFRKAAGPLSAPNPVSSVSGFTDSTQPQYWYPFCDNSHGFQDSSQGNCEAGLFVGRAVTTDSGQYSGGLTIDTNGTSANGPLVRDNGAIVLSDSGGLHKLTVTGGVQARRICGWGQGYLDSTGITDSGAGAEINATPLQCDTDYRDGSGNPFGGQDASVTPNVWNPTNILDHLAPNPLPPASGGGSQATPPSPTACTDTPLVTTNCMWPDPDWVHEPISLTATNPAVYDPTVAPRVDASAEGQYNLSPSSLCNSTGPGYAGFVAMPARQLPAADDITWTDVNGAPHTTHMYTAWYDNAADLNALTSNTTTACKDTVFWFRPGVYYFDFLDVSGATAWNVPAGCIPNCANGTNQVLAGSPDQYTAGGVPAGWSLCGHGTDPWAQPQLADILACAQPWKPLEPHTFTTSGAGSGFGLQDGNGQYERLDGYSPGPGVNANNVSTITLSTNKTNDHVKTDDFQSPIPQTPNVTIKHVDGLQFEVAYSLPSYDGNLPNPDSPCGNPAGTACYIDPSAGSGAHNDGTANTTGQGEGAELEIHIGGTGTGGCYIHLPPGDHSRLTTSNPNPGSNVWHAPSYPNQTGPESTLGQPKTATWTTATGSGTGDAIDIDLTNGCNANVPGFEQAGSPCLTILSNNCFPTAPHGWDAHPEWINYLNAQFNVSTKSSTPASPGATVSFDGIQMDAKWTGRPAPTFPDGCDTTAPGVQWIFGSSSRIDWSQTSDVYAELCANKESSWPGVTGSGSNYGIGVYGMSEDSAGLPPIWKSSLVPASKVTVLSNGSGAGSTNDLYFPQVPVGSAVASYPTFGTIDASESGAPPSAAGPPDVAAGKSVAYEWNSKNTLSLTYQLPSNFWTWYGNTNARPSGSFECGITAPLFPTDTSDPPVVGSGDPNGIPNDGSCGPNTIPYGSVITQVKIKVHHREGEWNAAPGASGVPTSGTFQNCGNQNFNGTSCINSVQLTIKNGPGLPSWPNTFGGGSMGSNGNNINPWNTTQPNAALTGNSIPISDPWDAYSSTHNGWRNWSWGNKTADTVASGIDPNTGNPASSDWSQQNDATENDLTSPEALAGALITYQVVPKDDGNWHYAELDGIELEVTYRPAGSLRPLQNCMTVRTAWVPATLEGVGTLGSGSRTGWTYDSGSGQYVYNGGGHDWLDQDWGINRTSGSSPFTGDQPVGDLSASNAGNGATTGDKNDCALINLDSSATKSRLHIVGTVYAPSAALALSGFANDGPWVTDAVLARQLSALRWKHDAGQASIADDIPPATYPRTVTIVVCDNSQTWTSVCSAPHIAVRAKIQFNDEQAAKYGYAADVLSWVRNPPS